jgi:hypothetical protein
VFPPNLIKHKVGLLNLAAELGNVSRACKVMGLSRDTFYRYQSAMQAGGVDALIDANRKKPNWLAYYNNDRTHQGKMRCCRTPIQTLIDGKEAWCDRIATIND